MVNILYIFNIYDIFSIIDNYSSIKEILILRLVNSQIKDQIDINFIKRKYFHSIKINLNSYFNDLIKKKTEIIKSYRLSCYFNPIIYHPDKLPYCINNQCSLLNTKKKNSLSWTCFYYPDNLSPPHDDQNDPYGINHEGRIRSYQCNNTNIKTIRCQFIPYCTNCMLKYVNYGYRNDNLEIPFRSYFSSNIW